MTVRIRLARFGCRHDPHYRINVANSWCKRDGRFIEVLGEYHPKPDADGAKRITLNFARAKYWLSVGAQPSDTVALLFGKVPPAARLTLQAGLLPSVPRGRPVPPISTVASISADPDAKADVSGSIKQSL